MKPMPQLQFGDIIGFKGMALVRWKTDGRAGHVAVYTAQGNVFTSETKDGVGIYKLSAQGDPVWIRRPKAALNPSALDWANTVTGRPYGWRDDIGVALGEADESTVTSMNCSHSSCLFLLHAGAPQFDPAFDPARVTPEHFETTYESEEIWNNK